MGIVCGTSGNGQVLLGALRKIPRCNRMIRTVDSKPLEVIRHQQALLELLHVADSSLTRFEPFDQKESEITSPPLRVLRAW
jgi:hypothetical protein